MSNWYREEEEDEQLLEQLHALRDHKCLECGYANNEHAPKCFSKWVSQ